MVEWCGCSLPEAVQLTSDRQRWRKLTGLNGFHGPWVAKKQEKKESRVWDLLLTFSHWSMHLAWNSWAQGSTRTSWCATKSYMQTTQSVWASPSACWLKLYDSSWSMSHCAKPCGVSPRLSARFSKACQHHLTICKPDHTAKHELSSLWIMSWKLVARWHYDQYTNVQNLRKWLQSLCAPLCPFRSEMKEKFYHSILPHAL